MKFSETDGTGITQGNKPFLLSILLLLIAQFSFANELYLSTNKDETLDGAIIIDNEFKYKIEGLMSDNGVFDGVILDSATDGTGGDKSATDGTGGQEGDGKSATDGTGKSLISILMSCESKNQSYGIIESYSGSDLITLDEIYLDGELLSCKS